MSDARLADLRRLVAQGEPGARAQLLQHRLRVGDLDDERVRLAASLWDEDALAILPVGSDRRMFDVTDLEPFGREVVERGCVATVRLLVPCWVAAFPDDDRIPRAVERAEQLVLLPFERRSRSDWVEGLQGAERDAATRLGCRYRSPQALAAVAVDYTLAGVIHDRMGSRVVAGHARESLEKSLRKPEIEARFTVHRALAADLVPWLLHERDPVGERVEAASQV